MMRAVTGHFTSMEQATLAAGELRNAGFEPDTISRQQLADGGVALTVLAGSREAEAIRAMSRHGAEAIEKQEGQEIGDISNAPREGDNAPVITEPADGLRVRGGVRSTPEERSPFERHNQAESAEGLSLAQSSGQYYDMMRTECDDGTVPPTAQREAITTPLTVGRDRTVPGAHMSSSGAPDSATAAPPDGPRQPETPLQEFAAHAAAQSSPVPDRAQVIQARSMIQQPVRSPAADAWRGAAAPASSHDPVQQRSTQMADTKGRNSKLTENPTPVFPPANANKEPTDSNPVPMSPTEPEHRTSDGAQEPAAGPAVFAVPAGNQAGVGTGGTAAGIAGIGVIQNPDDPQKRVAHEQPGEDAAHPQSTSLDREPISKQRDR